MILSDRGDQVIERWHAEMLMRGAKLQLKLRRSTFRPLGDPQERKIGGICGGVLGAGAGFEDQGRAAGDDAAGDSLGDLVAPTVMKVGATESPEGAGIQ